MFGFFKKRAALPSVELSEDELDLIHGGRPPSEMGTAVTSATRVPEFDARAAVIAVVGRGDARNVIRR